MKKILINILLILGSFALKAQYPIQQNLGSSTTLVNIPPNGAIRGGLIPRVFTDTTEANTYNIKYYDGAIIKTTSPIEALWWRDLSAQQWIQVVPSGSPTQDHFWTIRGNDLTGQSFYHYLGPLSSDSLSLITDSVVRLTIPASGIVRSSAATNVALTFDSVNKRLFYTTAPSSSAGWSLTGNAGTTAGTNFVGTTDAQDLVIKTNNTKKITVKSNNIIQINTDISNTNKSILQAGPDGSPDVEGGISFAIGLQPIFEIFAGENNKMLLHNLDDTIRLQSDQGFYTFGSLPNLTTQNRLLGQYGTSEQVGYITLGTGLSLSSGVLSAAASGLTVGTSPIASGTTTRILYDNAGVLGEYTITGTGTVVAMQTSPSFVTSVIGGASFDVFNTTSTTINAFGAATTMTIGGTPTTAITHNYSTNATATATTKTINFGTGGAAGSTTNINIGSSNGGTLTINEPTTVSNQVFYGNANSYNDQTGTTYTLVAGDNGKIVTVSNASAITVTVPASLPTGFNCTVVQKGAGQITFAASSTTLNNRQSFTKTAGQYAAVAVIMYASNTFILQGDMQ